MAWQSVKAKLVRGVSIGFRPIEYSYMDTGGIHFTASEIYELSLVTIPANASATIQTIKAYGNPRIARIERGVPLIQRANIVPSGSVRLIPRQR